MGKRCTIMVLFVSAVLAGSPAFAGKWSLIDGAPIADFTEADLSLFQKTVIDGLSKSSDGDRLDWNNPESGSAGSIVLIESKPIADIPCRLARIQNKTRKIEGNPNRTWFCRDESGQWKVHSLAK